MGGRRGGGGMEGEKRSEDLTHLYCNLLIQLVNLLQLGAPFFQLRLQALLS